METKIKIIDVLDKNKKGIHIREISRLVKTSYNNTFRNLKILEKENVIKKEKEANLIKIKLKNNPLTIAYLKLAHTENFLNLPKKIVNAINDFILELEQKPLIALIFGSYAKNNYTQNSDIEVFLVFDKIRKQDFIENTAKRISMRTNTKISPIYVDYENFKKNFLDKNHEFSNEIRQNIILILGLEIYYELLFGFLE
ncbi:MAG: nucleotidyltransferase domain-containing protein [Candidatus Woesearchaeota archaeon]